MRPGLDGMVFYSISVGEKTMLERRFFEDEVWRVVSSMKGDKALGPNEFSISFFQKCWDFVKNDLIEVLDEFYYS